MYQIKTLDRQFHFFLYISWRRRQFMMWHILSSYNVTCQKLHSSSYIDMKTIETQHDKILNDIMQGLWSPDCRVASCPPRPGECRRWCWRWSSLCSTPSLSPSCHEVRTLLTSTVTGEVRSEGGLGPLTLSVSLLPARGNSLQLCSNFYLQITKSNMSANLKTAAFTKFTSLQVLYYSYVSL